MKTDKTQAGKLKRFPPADSNRWKLATYALLTLIILGSTLYIYRYEPFSARVEVTDELGGNIFPVTILSTATTEANLIVPADSNYLGNPKSCIAVKVKSTHAYSKLHILCNNRLLNYDITFVLNKYFLNIQSQHHMYNYNVSLKNILHLFDNHHNNSL